MSTVLLPDISAFVQAKVERYCQLAAACLLVYEYFCTWNQELEFFWKKRWSFGKCIFLWSRYYSLIFNIGNATVFLQPLASAAVSVFFSWKDFRLTGSWVLFSMTAVSDNFFHWQNTGASLQVITTHVILELRLYAMYSSSRKILWLFILMTLSEASVMGVVVGMPVPGLRGTNSPSPGLFICADGDPIRRHWVSYYWTSLLITESILLSLSVYKAYVFQRTGAGGNLMRILTRDSVLYFIFIFGIYLGNQIIWLINDITLNEVGTGFSFCISTVLANRLMFAVRRHYYTPIDRFAETSRTTTVRFRQSQPGRAAHQLMSIDYPRDTHIEMQSFEERRGF